MALAMDDVYLGILKRGRRNVAGKQADWLKFLVSHNISPDEIGVI